MSDTLQAASEAIDRTEAVADAAHDAVDRAADCAIRAVKRIQSHPIQALATALIAGVILGKYIRK